MKRPLHVLHLDTESTWRGGENQLKLLLDGSRHAARSWVAAPPGSAAAIRLADHATVVALPMTGLKIVSAARKLVDLCRRENIAVIDAHTSKGHSLGLVMKRLAPELKLVVHRRVDYAPHAGWFSRIKYLSQGVTRYVAISHAIKGVLEAFGVQTSRISVVHSAVLPEPGPKVTREEAAAKVRLELGLDTTTPLIAAVGYLTTQKGHDTLLKSLAALKAGGETFRCLIAGDGPLKTSLLSLQRELGLENEVTFLGIRADVPVLLRASDILAMPSNYEGLGTTILDALHAGCAVAATNVGGIPEVIKHGKTGLLSPVGDAPAFAESLKRLLRSPALRRELASAGAAYCRDHFSVEKMVEGNLAVYEQVLTERH